jgi:aspartate aminotransferase-like enzyme
MSKYTLFTPGPVDVPDDVFKETAQPLVYHREEGFAMILNKTVEALKKILYTNAKIYFFTSSGTGAMEATCSNLLSDNDNPIIGICGKFGQRWLELCEVYHLRPHVIKEEYGKSLSPEKLEAMLKKITRPAVIFTTLAETSTGALNDIKTCGVLAQRYEAFFVVDGIAGIGADLFHQDEWHVDIAVGASQKALMSPPGISFISVTERALERMKKSTLPKYYFDIQIYEKFAAKNQTPWTPAISIFNGLKKSLDTIVAHGIENNFKHHAEMAEYVRDRIHKMELALFPEHPSNALTVIKMPENVISTEIIKSVKEKHNILFADGQAELKGSLIRIGHMGNYDVKKLSLALDAFEQEYQERRG